MKLRRDSYEKKLYPILILLCVLLFAAGCGEESSNNTPTVDNSGTKVTSSQSAESQKNDSKPQEADNSRNDAPAEEENTFVFTGSTMKKIEKPDKVTVIPQFKKIMGEDGKDLSSAQIDSLVKKINALQLKEYDYNKSKIVPLDGGGYMAECYYGQKKVTFNFMTENVIEMWEEGKDKKYYKDDSNNFNELVNFFVGIVA